MNFHCACLMDKLYKINHSDYILHQRYYNTISLWHCNIGKCNDNVIYSKVNYKQITSNYKIFLSSVRRNNFDKPLNNI